MGETLKTFTQIFAVSVIACVLIGGGLSFIIAAVVGYAIGMFFIEDKLI
jgi:K+-transporting ATPase A subunit|tara:strand:- start:1892 stop:2038 length:147 start_codon:yes stop_codon:yes gene_type:complete